MFCCSLNLETTDRFFFVWHLIIFYFYIKNTHSSCKTVCSRIMEVESYYDSEEEIAWGPVTLREIKHDLLKAQRKRISRRNTVGELKQKTTDSDPTQKMADTKPDDIPTITIPEPQLNISKQSSEYFTPNSTIKDKNNSVETDNNLQYKSSELCSVYASAVEDTLVEKTFALHLSPTKNYKTMLGNIEQTLVENTIIISSDEEDDENEPRNEPYYEKPEVKFELLSDNALSDISASEEKDNVFPEDEGNEYDIEEVQRTAQINLNNTDEAIDLQEITQNRSKKYTNVFSLSDSLEESTSHKSEYTNTQTQQSAHNCSTDFSFNDTMEEMERALQEGLEYSMPNEKKCDSAKKPVIKITVTPSVTPVTSAEKKTPQATLIPKAVHTKTPNDLFKMPNKPPMVSPITSNKFKNIKSPVHVYIHNSQKPFLRQNMPAKNTNISPMPKIDIQPKNKGAECTLPKVLYKPSKLKVVSTEKQLNLPSSIKKLVPEPKLIKHDKKVGSAQRQTIVSQNLFDSNLTADSSTLSEVSFVTNKQTFKK